MMVRLSLNEEHVSYLEAGVSQCCAGKGYACTQVAEIGPTVDRRATDGDRHDDHAIKGTVRNQTVAESRPNGATVSAAAQQRVGSSVALSIECIEVEWPRLSLAIFGAARP